ncbi:hypothetical protein BDC45DRAFT_512418 [Circinella umbellata]|nr:hypothetical protein BDC45DRAFT_512418 [Circinella umbellata]
MLAFSNLFTTTTTTSSIILNPSSNENNTKKKQRRRISRISFSSVTTLSSPSTTLPTTKIKTTIDILPSEILLLIFNNLIATDLINMSSSNSYFYHLINQHNLLIHKLKDSTLRLFFRQESRWCCTVDMKLVRHDENRLIFKPVDQDTGFRMFTSKVLRDPSLYKITLNDQPVMLTKKSTSLKIKETTAYRKSLDTMAIFCYSVHPTPADWAKLRPGERWILPLLLECHPLWFMQHHGYTTAGKQLTHRMLEAFS